MLFKRYLFLAACVLAFIFGFIAYFTIARAQMEEQFRQEREKFNVEGVNLTSTNAPASTPAPAPSTPVASTPASSSTPIAPDSSSAAPAPATSATSTDSSSTSSSSSMSSSPAETPAPALNPASADTNVLIGPVPPPPASSTPDSTPSSSPSSSPDNSTAPAATPTPSTTMDDRGIRSFLVRAAYHPYAETEISSVETNHASSAPVASPVTNSASSETSKAETAAPATNAAPAAAPETATGHASKGEASVIVLLYHQFTAPEVHAPPKMQWTMNVDVFAAEMKYIHDNGYHVIPMSDLIKFLHHEITLPPNSVVITIDDGYKSAVVYAAPILKQYGYPWTFFIYPDFVTVAEGKGAVSWNDLLALQADGVDIESHSMTHPQLPKHTQKWKGSVHALSPEEYDEWLTNETLGSKNVLEQKLGKPVLSLAYPYGAYNKEVEAKAIAAGYQYIFTVADNPVHSTTDPHSIGRYTITQGVEKNFAAYLRQGALGLSDADPGPGATTSNPRPVISAVLGYAGTIDPNSIETSVRDFGDVRHDWDPKTSTIRLYLPRDLIQPVNLVNIRVKDAQTGQVMVANWHFNYEPAGGAPTHAPITGTATNAPAAATNAAPASVPAETPLGAGASAATSSATNSAPAASTPSTSTNQVDPPAKNPVPSSAASKSH